MADDSNKEKQQAHQLIDQLDPAQVSAVVHLLQFMLLDAVSRSLAGATVEQEPISAEEAAALDQAGRRSIAARAFPTKTFSASSASRAAKPFSWRKRPFCGHRKLVRTSGGSIGRRHFAYCEHLFSLYL